MHLPVVIVLLLCAGGSGPVAGAGEPDDPAFAAFWRSFRQAVVDGRRELVADFTQLPILLDGAEQDRKAFLRTYDTLFTPAMIACFRKGKPIRDLDAYELFCGEQIFLFGSVNGRYRFTEIGVND